MKKLLLATKNPGKVLEYREIFKELDLGIELVNLKDLGITGEPLEDGKTFEENAVKKARFYSAFSDLPILAEDSGLEIDYLNGEPGVFSRRWPGHDGSDEELIQMALEKLKGVPWEKRGAQLRVVIALRIPTNYESKRITNDETHLFEGILRGYITEKPLPSIIKGYPFRSLFYVPQIDKILGELTMEEEARVAHRKKALKKALPILKKFLT